MEATKGPWSVHLPESVGAFGPHAAQVVGGYADGAVADCYRVADAGLIAAAPALLAERDVLRAALADIGRMGSERYAGSYAEVCRDMAGMARAALAQSVKGGAA